MLMLATTFAALLFPLKVSIASVLYNTGKRGAHYQSHSLLFDWLSCLTDGLRESETAWVLVVTSLYHRCARQLPLETVTGRQDALSPSLLGTHDCRMPFLANWALTCMTSACRCWSFWKMRRVGVWRGRKGGMFEREANERILRAAIMPPSPHLANISTHECLSLC